CPVCAVISTCVKSATPVCPTLSIRPRPSHTIGRFSHDACFGSVQGRATCRRRDGEIAYRGSARRTCRGLHNDGSLHRRFAPVYFHLLASNVIGYADFASTAGREPWHKLVKKSRVSCWSTTTNRSSK